MMKEEKEESVFVKDRGINQTIMPFGRSLLQRESLLRVSGEERSMVFIKCDEQVVKNFFSVIFGSVSLILVFFDTTTILRFLCRIPRFRRIPTTVQILLFCIGKALFSLLLVSVAVKLGYVFMEDLSQVVSQFYPGAMAGGPGTPTPPGPSDNLGLFSYPLEGESSHQGERRGSPSLADEFPFLTEMSTPDLSVFDEVMDPLKNDDQRRQELHIFNSYDNGVSSRDRVDLQVDLEKRLENSLRADGYTDQSILGSRHAWRRAAFTHRNYPNPISNRTLRGDLELIKNGFDIKTTGCYRRIKN